MHKFFERLRAAFFFIIILGAMGLCAVDLMKIQVVDGAEYLEKAKTTRQASQIITSPRGEIVDVNGNEIVSNKTGFNVVIEKAFFPSDNEGMNRVILGIARLLGEDGVAWIDDLPITRSRPYSYLEARDSDAIKLRKNIELQHYATAEDCLAEMYKRYGVDESLSEEEKRIIAGIRYEMFIRSFSLSNRYTFAEDIPMDTVVRLKEAAYTLDGMDIVEEAIRVYEAGDVAPHLIGTVGAINAEEYEENKENGYALNDVIGKSGIEKAMESVLRGTKGTRTLELLNGAVVSDMVTEEAVPGNTVKLTLDMDYQRKVQEILENHILWLNNQTSRNKKGENADAGAIVVLDVKTGALLAAATAPTYDLNDYLTDYASVISRENTPLVNRATNGLYRPGSTFKTVTATAALNEGYINRNTIISCGNKYTYWDDYQPKCTGWHGGINVITAIEKSCNIFFYEVGRLMGPYTIEKYANMYGLGDECCLETGGAKGKIATPDTMQQANLEWQAGLVVQVAIGQSETAVTPLQMAVQASTIANKGVRYQPHIVDSVYTYNMEELVSKSEPQVTLTIPDNTGETFSLVTQGMKQAAAFLQYSYPTQKDYYTPYLLTDLPKEAAIKTGTPQVTSADDTSSAFIGFYPADDPEIAFSGMVEHGEYSKFMIRQLIEAYYDKSYVVPKPVIVTDEAVMAGLAD
ncbi:MAG: penicillin-binding transpeptidase domain-containing protein [Prevotella sp.]|nr:penicillin-binding transpeptidase domain-containing protein [Prevotella sp.]